MKARHHAAAPLALVILLLAATSDVAVAESRSSRLFGPAYFSTSVIRDGERYSLVEGTRLRIKFGRGFAIKYERGENIDGFLWRAGCNRSLTEAEITPRRLLIGGMISTALSCGRAIDRQESRLTRFFRSDPCWAARGRRLKLKSNDTVIRLRRRTAS